MNDIIIPDIVAFIIFGVLLGAFLGIILAFAFRMTAFVWAGMLAGVVSGVITHWLTKHNVQLQSPISGPPHVPSDIEHMVRIFELWARNQNFTTIAGVIIVWIIVWGMIKITKINAENPRIVHHYYTPESGAPTLPPYKTPPLLEGPKKEENRGRLPVKQG